MKICVVGAGYVGLVMGSCLAGLGYHVSIVDHNRGKILGLQNGRVPISEPGLGSLLNIAGAADRICYSSSLARSAGSADMIFVAVETPPGKNGLADLSMVRQVVRELARVVDSPKKIVVKSTVPVGTARMLQGELDRLRGGNHGMEVFSNPEFLREGSAVYDFFHPDRVVIGAGEGSEPVGLLDIYKEICRQVIVTTWENAELIKYASNAFLATKITFINEISRLCEAVGADVVQVAEGIGCDPRIGPHFLQAGLGYGGSCLPKDLKALIASGAARGCMMKLLQAVDEVNTDHRQDFCAKVVQNLARDPELAVCIWGLAFKPGTDDIRESPALEMVSSLRHLNCRIKAHDPEAIPNFSNMEPGLEYFSCPYEAARGADALVIITDWPDYIKADLPRLGSMLKTRTVFDGRNIFDPDTMRRLGYNYYPVGRANASGLSGSKQFMPEKIFGGG